MLKSEFMLPSVYYRNQIWWVSVMIWSKKDHYWSKWHFRSQLLRSHELEFKLRHIKYIILIYTVSLTYYYSYIEFSILKIIVHNKLYKNREIILLCPFESSISVEYLSLNFLFSERKRLITDRRSLLWFAAFEGRLEHPISPFITLAGCLL